MGFFNSVGSEPEVEGRRVFYPWGPLARGVVLASESELKRLRRALGWFAVLSLVVIFLAGSTYNMIGAAAAAGCLLLLHAIWLRRVCRGRPRTRRRLTFREDWKHQAGLQSNAVLWLRQVGTIAMTLTFLGLWISLPEHPTLALAGATAFGLASLQTARMLRLRARRAPPVP